MKKIAVLILFICLLLAAGCTGSAPAQTTPVPTTAAPQVAPKEPSVISSGNYSLRTAIDHIEVEKKDSGARDVNIYLRLTNTGNESIRLVWYSKLTDMNGMSHGGVGVSHGGSGAATFIFVPNTTGTMRDFVTIANADDYAALKKGGATLDIYYADQKNPLEPIAGLHSNWTLEPAYFT